MDNMNKPRTDVFFEDMKFIVVHMAITSGALFLFLSYGEESLVYGCRSCSRNDFPNTSNE